MKTMGISGVELRGVELELGSRRIDNLEALAPLVGDRAEAIVKTTGIATRYAAADGESPLSLCCAAAERLIAKSGIAKSEFGAVVFVSFTAKSKMPALAAQAQARLGLPESVAAFDLTLACSGYVHGLYLAASLARDLVCPVLLLDGDVQSDRIASDDYATAAVLSDGGTATIVAPRPDAPAWRFAFATFGAQGAALQLDEGGCIRMDGFGVFRFVAAEVTRFLKDFAPSAEAVLVPHQPNAYMVRELARSAGFAADRVLVSADRVGNLSSASIPATAALAGGMPPCALLCGFGGGLAIAAAEIRSAE